jgi:hypothetical protein
MTVTVSSNAWAVDAGAGASAAILSNKQKIDMDDTFYMIDKDMSVITSILMHPDFDQRPARAIKVEWIEDERLPEITQTSTDDSGTGTTTSIAVTASTGVYFRVNDLLRMETTGEIMRVDNVVGDTLTVTRGIGVSGSNTANDWGTTNGLYLTRIGHASLQGATMPQIKQIKGVANYNYTQIQRNGYKASRTAQQVGVWAGGVLANSKAQASVQHKIELEDTYWFGQRDLKIGASMPQTFTGGILSYINSNNVTAVNGALSVSVLEDVLEKAFRYNTSGEAWAFAGTKAFRAFAVGTGTGMGLLTRVASNEYGANKTYGVSVNRYVAASGLGAINLVCNRRWNDTTTSGVGKAGLLAILDLSKITRRPLQDTVHLENRQLPDEDADTKEFLTESSIEVVHGRCHALATGITG